MNNYRAGHFAEKLALLYLRCKGYHLLAQNYVTGRGTHAGEVDLIVRRGKTLVFVEVKKRSSLEEAAYAVRPPQQQRIRRAAEAFLAKNPLYAGYDLRFDAVLIRFPFQITHLQSAF